MPSPKSPSRRPGTLAILCGGLSSRLGTDKGLYRPGNGPSLLEHLLTRLGGAFSNSLVVVRDDLQAGSYVQTVAKNPGTRLIKDTDQDPTLPRAAIAGLLTAMCKAETDPLIVLPVDQLAIQITHLDRLLSAYLEISGAADGSACPVAFGNTAGHPIAFPSVWPLARLSALEAAVRAGSYSIKGVLAGTGCHLVTPDAEDHRALAVNGNTPGEISSFFALAGQGITRPDEWAARPAAADPSLVDPFLDGPAGS